MKFLFTKNQKQLRARLLEIIYKNNGSHIGSCISSLDLIDAVYAVKKKGEKFILSNGHAATALYVILEKNKYLIDPDLNKLNVHPDRNPKIGIDASTGSLGQGLPIALGMALSDQTKNVYCLISDGECAEGSIWESLRIVHDLRVLNLKIIVSVNGWGGYDPISGSNLLKRFKGFGFDIIKVNGHQTDDIINKLRLKVNKPTILFAKTSSTQFPFLIGLDAHYYTMTESDYKSAIKILV